MAKIKSVAIFLGLFLLIGIIHGLVSNSINIFITWFLIGIWLIYSYKVLKSIKQYREFNSPHNTAFFIVGPIIVGIFYSIWSNFTGLLGENLLEGSDLYLSWWSILFALPYILFGSISIYRCFKKYNVIYFGRKSVNARIFGYFICISIILFIIIYWIGFYSLNDFYESLIPPIHFLIDLNLLFLLIGTISIFVIHGLVGSNTRLPRLSRDYIAQRTSRLNTLSSPQRQSSRSTIRTSSSPSTRTVSRVSSSVSHSTRSTPTTHTRTTSSRSKTTYKNVRSKPKNFNLYKPKAARISAEDFKCIFCFQLPESPKDNGRGIVLCPKCRYPAHADEFKDWLTSSNLCSRCNAPIPASFRRNPKIISVKNYLVIIKHFIGRKS